MTQHTVKAFDAEIGELRGLIAEMGGLAERALAGAMLALRRHDLDGAAAIVAGDKRIDQLEAQVEKLAIQVIALRAPMANDLREVIAALKIAGLVERMGDYAKNIAKRVPLVEDPGEAEALSILPTMADAVVAMVRDVLDAFAVRDAERASRVCDDDRRVDDLYDALFRVLVTHMMENPRTIGQMAHLMFVAKNLERIGDHATNVAEMVYYAASGRHMAERDRGASAIG